MRDESRVSVEIACGVIRRVLRLRRQNDQQYQHSPFPRPGSDSPLKRNSYSSFVDITNRDANDAPRRTKIHGPS